jgi:hypothetical protein
MKSAMRGGLTPADKNKQTNIVVEAFNKLTEPVDNKNISNNKSVNPLAGRNVSLMSDHMDGLKTISLSSRMTTVGDSKMRSKGSVALMSEHPDHHTAEQRNNMQIVRDTGNTKGRGESYSVHEVEHNRTTAGGTMKKYLRNDQGIDGNHTMSEL